MIALSPAVVQNLYGMRRRLPLRKATAAVCIALVVFAAFLPVSASPIVYAVLTPLWLVIPAVAVTLIRREAGRSTAQPVSLLAIVPFRAPPAGLGLV